MTKRYVVLHIAKPGVNLSWADPVRRQRTLEDSAAYPHLIAELENDFGQFMLDTENGQVMPANDFFHYKFIIAIVTAEPGANGG